ncbi:MAG: 50S ribosomal protein L5 [Candidatus Thermoplasmatota archaeon]|nr:50S ribosomal protein L5 [Candidatus Thermoplasmatota archaeon]MCL5730540.1 50S ribosomal protein L5 [Candidatus Thermoplasmatota archaeon]
MNRSNQMSEITIDKVVLNIGVGQAGERLTKAAKVLELLTSHRPVLTKSTRTVRDFNIRKGLTIGAKVTLRRKDAEEFLTKAFYAKGNKIPYYSFDMQGNAYFGIHDYTDFKGMKYDPDIGIFGMDVAIVMKRKGGYRVSRRRIGSRKIPEGIRVSKEETQKFLKERFGVEIVG